MMMMTNANYNESYNIRITTTKAVWIAIFHCSITVLEENWISS